jgi:UDP-N-acetylmuramoyl-tripeptide--D-alanyl-D-alanine ligase
VVEVGARGLGHIAALMPMVQPDVAVVTNVGAAHVGMFGSIDNIATAKGELVEALGTSGVAVLNADDPRVNAMRERTHAPVLTFGLGGTADVRAEDVSFDDEHRARFTIVAGAERASTTLRVPGEHMVANAVAAAAAAIACGVSLDGAATGLAGCEGVPMRVQVVPDGDRRIINDAYNASPDSMAVALKTLVAMARGRPTWAVLGPMAELGDHAIEAHDRIGRLAVRLGVGHLVTVGHDALALHEAARLEGMPPDEAVLVESTDEAIDVLRARLEPDAVVLVKASRAAGLERVVEGLLA